MQYLKISKGFMFVSGLVLAGCDLDEFNPAGMSADATWDTPEGFMTAVNAAYDNQTNWYGRENGVFLGESGTDLWFNQERASYARQLTRYEALTPTNGNPNLAEWPRMWAGINQCNAGINRIDEAGFGEEERNQRLGELRFLRAFYYWHIVETWGGVMLRTQETDGPILTAERSPVEAFYELIFEDLQFAAEHLPGDQGEEYSRATRKSAMGMLARAYLSRAYYGDEQEYFTLARDAAQEIIERSGELGIALWDSVEELWDPDNNTQNQEALHIVSYASNPNLNRGGANRLHQFYLTEYTRYNGLNRSMEYGNEDTRRLMPTRALLDLFDEEMDARYEASFQEVWIANEDYTWTEEDAENFDKDPAVVGYTVRAEVDTALYITKESVPDKATRPYPVFDRDDVYQADGSIRDGMDFVPLIKFRDPLTRLDESARESYLDVFAMRLAEIYLIAAEAELQLGDPAAAAEYVNVLRTRAAKKEPVDYTGEMQVSVEDIDLDFILDERARELCGELLRWFDLKRTGALGDRIERFNPDITQFQQHHVLRPIPQTELDMLQNGAEFGQNAGY